MHQAQRIFFAHGQESGPWGNKIQALAAIAESYGLAVTSPDYSDIRDDAEARADRLAGLLEQEPGPVVLAGSSMGAWVSVREAVRTNVAGLFLLAPALSLPGHRSLELPGPAVPSVLVHGWQDDIVPVEQSITAARAAGSELLLVRDGHRLQEALPRVEAAFRAFLDGLGLGSGVGEAGAN